MTAEDTAGASDKHEPPAELLRDVFDLADDVIDRITNDDVEARLRRLRTAMTRRTGNLLDPPEGFCPTAPDTHAAAAVSRTASREPGPADLEAPGAVTSRRRFAAPTTGPGEGIHRAADSAMSLSGSLVASFRDLRGMDRSGREETGAMIARLRDLFDRCPAGTFDEEASAAVLARVATLSEALVADRDERGALHLIKAATPHLLSLGPHHPAVFEVRRTHAEACLELGHHRQAESLLRRLNEDERRVLGREDQRTALLLLWTLVGDGRLREADAGFRDLNAREVRRQGAGAPGLWHLQCRYAWLLGRQGRTRESAESYDGVIINRSHLLGVDHPDALDARHSKGKMLVLADDGPQAVTLLQVLHDDRARVQGDRHPDTLETLKYLHLARAWAESGNERVLDKAIDVLGGILRIQIERAGSVHPLSRDTAMHLDQIRRLRQATRYRETVDLRPGWRWDKPPTRVLLP